MSFVQQKTGGGERDSHLSRLRVQGSSRRFGLRRGRLTGAEEGKKEGVPACGEKIAAAVVSFVAIIFIGVVAALLKSGLDTISAIRDGADNARENNTAGESAQTGGANEDTLNTIRENRENQKSGGSSESSESSESGADMSDRVQVYSLPKSEFLSDLVETLFGKPVNQVSYEELSSIIYLDVYYLEDTDVMAVDVILSDETSESYLVSDYYVDTADFDCLEGLEYLYLEACSMSYSTDWSHLKNLHYLSCDASMTDLTDYMDVSQLIYLSTDETFGMQDLSVLSEYTSLEYLELDAGLLDSIAGVSGAASLRGLYIEDGDSISDFSELYHMPWLEELSIQSKGLKDIGFISEMENLQYLSLEETQIKRLDALSDCADTLVALSLKENYQIEDISPVMECTGLEELQLWVEYQFDIPMEAPDFSVMPNLRSLSIEGYDRFSNLALLTGLTELTIECPGSGDGEFLKSLPNLQTLNLVDMSVYSGLIEGIASLEGLETLSLEDSFIWCDISPVFGLPNLQTLNLEWAECGLRPELLTCSESLASLKLAYADFDYLREDGSWDYGNYETEIPMQEVLDVLSPNMPALRELYVPDHELENLDFTENLPQLMLLDVTNNYITDLSPLMNLEQLSVLMCGNNPLRSTDGLDGVIICE